MNSEELIAEARRISLIGVQINDGHKYIVSSYDISNANDTLRALANALEWHLAQEAGLRDDIANLEAERANAWDEGFDAGERDVHMHETFDEPCIKNPYRTEKQ